MTVDWALIRSMPDCYHVIVSDNYHYQDPDEQYAITGFASEAEALAECREIVERCLVDFAEPGKSADEVYSAYTMFGDDPSIVGAKGSSPVKFSGWNYAREHAGRFVRPQASS